MRLILTNYKPSVEFTVIVNILIKRVNNFEAKKLKW